MFIPESGFFSIPDPGVKKALDPGSESATMVFSVANPDELIRIRILAVFFYRNSSVKSTVAYPHHWNANPDPSFHFSANPDPTFHLNRINPPLLQFEPSRLHCEPFYFIKKYKNLCKLMSM